MKNRREEILGAVKSTIEGWRRQHGLDICTDVQVFGRYAMYSFQPGEPQGYTVEVDLTTGESHHKGNGEGCFWTDWEECY